MPLFWPCQGSAGSLNSGPHASAERILPTETPLQPWLPIINIIFICIFTCCIGIMPQPVYGGQGKLAGLSSFLKTYRFQGSNFDY